MAGWVRGEVVLRRASSAPLGTVLEDARAGANLPLDNDQQMSNPTKPNSALQGTTVTVDFRAEG